MFHKKAPEKTLYVGSVAVQRPYDAACQGHQQEILPHPSGKVERGRDPELDQYLPQAIISLLRPICQPKDVDEEANQSEKDANVVK